MADLKTRVEELKSENEYQLRLKDMSYNDKIKELTEKFIQEMEALKTKNQVSLSLDPSFIMRNITLHFHRNNSYWSYIICDIRCLK